MPLRLSLTVSCLSLCLFLAGCGFEPMYGRHAGSSQTNATVDVADGFNQVAIGNIPDREGSYLRNELIDRLYAGGYPTNPRYTLRLEEISETKRNLDITKSSEATRGQLIQRSVMILEDRQNPAAPVMRQTLTATTSYNVLESEFATRVTEDNARLSGLSDIARQVELNLALFFNRDKNQQSTP